MAARACTERACTARGKHTLSARTRRSVWVASEVIMLEDEFSCPVCGISDPECGLRSVERALLLEGVLQRLVLVCARRCLEVRERVSRHKILWVRLDAVEVRGVVLGEVRHVRLVQVYLMLLLYHVCLLTSHGVVVERYVGLVVRRAPSGLPK